MKRNLIPETKNTPAPKAPEGQQFTIDLNAERLKVLDVIGDYSRLMRQVIDSQANQINMLQAKVRELEGKLAV